MNIYDFDNTILKGDSSFKFIVYSLVRHPIKVIPCLFKGLKLKIKKEDLGNIKSAIFSFVKSIPSLEEYVNKFIFHNLKHVKGFYLNRQKESDIVISATFDFIIVPFCHKLGINNVIATKYDVKEGSIIGLNCKGEEKVRRLKEEFGDITISEAYSDSLSDEPMLKLASKSYLVKGENLILYQKTDETK